MTSQSLIKEQERENVVPCRPLSVFDEMERMLEGMMPRSLFRPFRWESAIENLPQVDVIDRDDHIFVRVALPGVKKEDLEVSTTDHTVTIRGKTSYECKEEEEGEFYRREVASGHFLRTISLPASIDETKVKAVYRDGMLELTLPKLEHSKRHTIKIEEA